MKRLFAYLILVFACPVVLSAQDVKWDSALDQYQRITDSCISLRIRSAAGEPISAASVAQLLGQLSSLRRTLQDAGGEMTPAQRMRFQSIKMRYDEVFATPRPEPLAPIAVPACLLAGAYRLNRLTLNPPSFEDYALSTPVDTHLLTGGDAASWNRPSVGVILYCGVPDVCYGAMATLSKGRLGAFVKASSSIPNIRADYSCFSDGTTPGGYIWTSGGQRVCRWSATAGAAYVPWKFLTLYAGAGYGSRTLLWQDVSERWAAVEDRSVAGLCLDGGVILNLGRFSLLAGASSIGFGSLNAELGLGFRW